MLEVNGVRLIDRMLSQLRPLGLERIVIVTGYRGKNLRRHIAEHHPDLPTVFVDNPVYDRTNNIYSLWLARDYFAASDTTLLLESDLIFEDAVLRLAVDSPDPDVALVSKYETWNDGTMVCLNEHRDIVSFITKKAFNYADTDRYYKTVNIYRFSREFLEKVYLPFLDAYIKVVGENEYYEQVLRVVTMIDNCGLKALPVNGLHWYEIDDVQDLRIAETIFSPAPERLRKLQHSFGGYWRYNGLLDFCYLVNPYFPPQRMIDEMKANFEALLRDYPSGMGVNSLLAAKYYSLRHEYVAVGNGAAELIKALMELNADKRVGVIYPTFEEYPNRLPPGRVVAFCPGAPDFAYTADDLIIYFSEHPVDLLLLVNPDNPSGHLLTRSDVERLLSWAEKTGIKVVIDESFLDFADHPEATSLLNDSDLAAHPCLCVMKSISKSYGVPGLRLGILASSDTALIGALRRSVAIWNINSFAEFYMQIFNKYEHLYREACGAFRRERARFAGRLREVEWLRVIPSQANYFLCEVMPPMTAAGVALDMLDRHNILLKECSTKKGFPEGSQYLRIAVRDASDNNRLVDALKTLCR